MSIKDDLNATREDSKTKNLKIVIAIGLFFFISNINALGQDSLLYTFVKSKSTDSSYNLNPVLDSVCNLNEFYRPNFTKRYSFDESMKLLKSLLEFEGDTSECSVALGTYPTSNPNRPGSCIYPLDSNYTTLTIEIQALFLFNMLIEHKAFYIACYPRLQAKKIGCIDHDKLFEMNDPRVKLIYSYYRTWLEKCEKKKSFDIGGYPLDESGYSWL
ncbi:MAG: hypothetical protein NXI10_17430 [bacterium]|nr:hypothetical protein [bacterium]